MCCRLSEQGGGQGDLEGQKRNEQRAGFVQAEFEGVIVYYDDTIRPGDALDFWRVLIADRKTQRLLLYAEMKLPGEAWLEFSVDNKPPKTAATASSDGEARK